MINIQEFFSFFNNKLLTFQSIFIRFRGTFIYISIFEYFFLFQFRYKAYHNKENQMQDKNTLINSMNNLINHISISRRNQQQMFASLSRKDFDKIISNLDDSLLKLRITTVKLLTQLLYNNEALKQKFCELMGIQFYNNSNIVLNGSLQKVIEKYQKKQLQLYTLLKQHAKSLKQVRPQKKIRQPLLWYINLRNLKLCIEYIQRQQFATISNFTNKSAAFDPLECVFGVSICSQDEHQGYGKSVISLAATTDASKVKNIGQTKQPQNSQDNFIIKNNQSAYNNKHINYQPVYIPMSAKSAAFSKQNSQKVGNYSFTSGSSQAPYQIKNNLRQTYKPGRNDQHFANSSYDTPQYLQTSSSIQNPSNSTSKKQNEEKNWKQNQKYSNRLSLQLNDFKAVRKVNQFQPETNIGYSEPLRIQNLTQPNQHPHGIKILTPRQSLRHGQGHKISILNSGAQTERMNTQRQNTVTSITDRERPIQTTESVQRIKTIHLGGFRGIESAREKRNIKIQRH